MREERRVRPEEISFPERRQTLTRRQGLIDVAYNLEKVWRHAISLLFVLWGVWVLVLPMDVTLDYLRALAFGLGTELIIVNLLINYSYRRSSRLATGEAKGMPRHIRWVATSYLLSIVALLGAVYDQMGMEVKWYALPTTLLALVTGIIALGFMFRFAVAKQGIATERPKSRK